MFHRPSRFLRHEARGAAAPHILVFVAAVSVARNSRDEACCDLHLAHAVVHCIGDVEIVLSIDHHGFRRMEHGSDRRLVVTVVAISAHAGHCRDNATAVIDAADAVTALVDENNIAFPVQRVPDDVIEPGIERRLSIVEVHGHIQSI